VDFVSIQDATKWVILRSLSAGEVSVISQSRPAECETQRGE